MGRPRALLSWSSGKDSAYALVEARRAGEVEVVGLVTTVNTTHDRVAMHAVRRTLLEAQAAAVGLPLFVVDLPWPCPNAVYEEKMSAMCARSLSDGIDHFVFGDLFLEDIRAYREAQLARAGMKGVYPLWGRDTRALAHEMIASGLSARLTCVDPKKLDRAFAGRTFDAKLLTELPPSVDPCGENGEFHTFVTHGPMFSRPVEVTAGEVVERDGFVFADLYAAAPDQSSAFSLTTRPLLPG